LSFQKSQYMVVTAETRANPASQEGAR